MAKNKDTDNRNVTRIKASSTPSVKKEKTSSKVMKTKTSTKSRGTDTGAPKKRFILFRPFATLFSYFGGAWFELRQVHWPTRRATWGLTGAVILFTGFFVILILLLDALFKYVFQLILG